jgi:hypothetical protein
MIDEINGFKIISHLDGGENPRCVVICKKCNKEWETGLYTLKNKISCGCVSWKQLKPLPEFINGFRTIKCHGYNTVKKNGRWATVECKVCKRIYDCDPNNLKYRQHCGCMKNGVVACRYVKTHPQLAQAFKHMVSRCYNKNDKDYFNYGERGIKVCAEWLQNRNRFCEWSLANCFENNKKLSIDRIDSDKGYNPDNCRWVGAKEQGRNTRRVKMTIENAREIRKKYSQSPCHIEILNLAEDYGVSDATIYLIIQNKTWKE